MSSENKNQFSEQLERFLDGLMTDQEAAAFRERHRDDAEFVRATDLDSQLEQSLGNMFPKAEMSDELKSKLVAEILNQSAASTPDLEPETFSGTRRSGLRLAVLAALLLIAVTIAWTLIPQQRTEPFFQQVALVELHTQLNEKGYRPYYNCDDEQRFADVFVKRQGVALRLKPMDPGCSMLGISYVGGLSRDTTAMLGTVNGENVTVFVDSSGVPQPNAIIDKADGLNVFQRELEGLVLYEISPHNEPSLLEYFEIPNLAN